MMRTAVKGLPCSEIPTETNHIIPSGPTRAELQTSPRTSPCGLGVCISLTLWLRKEDVFTRAFENMIEKNLQEPAGE